MMPEKKQNLQTVRNFRRRNFLKYSLLVGGGFLAGKFLDSLLGLFSSEKESALKSFELAYPREEEKTTLFKNFVVKETEKELGFYDRKDGHEIFVIEK